MTTGAGYATDFWHPAVAVGSTLMPELVGVAEIAEMFSTTPRTVQRWLGREELAFPMPVGELAGRRRVWHRSAVERWGKKHLPLPKTGRPPKTG